MPLYLGSDRAIQSGTTVSRLRVIENGPFPARLVRNNTKMAMPNDVWEEISQDIPSASDPFLQQYMAGREHLMNQEKAKRTDAAFRTALSPIAKRACRIVDNIRNHERETVWTPNLDQHKAADGSANIFPGMMFMHAKEKMEDTKLWNIVRQMPKGCLLHAHLDAMVDINFIIDELMKLPGMHMSSDRPLTTPEAMEDAAFSFRYRSKTKASTSLWSEDYQPNSFLPIVKVAEEFPNGARGGFQKWLYGRCTLSVADSDEQRFGIDAIWRKFAKCFLVVDTMIHYEPMFRVYLRRLMSVLKADGINWAELRYV